MAVFMLFNSLMKGRKVVIGVWQATIGGGGGKHILMLLQLMEALQMKKRAVAISVNESAKDTDQYASVCEGSNESMQSYSHEKRGHFCHENPICQWDSLANGSDDQTRNQDVLSHLLRNLASLAEAGTSGAVQNVPNTDSQGPESSKPFSSSTKMADGLIHLDPPASRVQREMIPANNMAQNSIDSGSCGVGSLKSPLGPQSSNVLQSRDSLPQSVAAKTTVRRNGLSNIDLNDVCDDVQDLCQPCESPAREWPLPGLQTGPPPDPHTCHSLCMDVMGV
ncbi:hypothetical protein RJT34_14428 [Clitoria ternatea]|uniref:Uncharacterized protein n=1 Tax=Clitoria ternatea TaxID=43366 RepID=A0AAN9JSH5_CLITE